jgi:hypothetical protein
LDEENPPYASLAQGMDENPPYAGLAEGNGFGSQHKLSRLLLLIKGVTNMI